MKWILPLVALVAVVGAIPDYDNFEEQECHQVEECE